VVIVTKCDQISVIPKDSLAMKKTRTLFTGHEDP
jgi:hypothetical protein